MKAMTRAWLSKVAGAAYCAGVLIMGVRAGEPTEVWWWLGALLFLGWVASPIVGGLLLAKLIRDARAFAITMAGLAIVAILGFAEQWHVMFVGPSDAQNALILIFVPFLQWVGVGVVMGIGVLLDRHVYKA